MKINHQSEIFILFSLQLFETPTRAMTPTNGYKWMILASARVLNDDDGDDYRCDGTTEMR